MSDEFDLLVALDQAEIEANNAAANAAHAAEAALIEEAMQAEEDAFQAWVANLGPDEDELDFEAEFDLAQQNNGIANDNLGWNAWVAPSSPIYSDVSSHFGTKPCLEDLFDSTMNAKQHHSLSRRCEQ